MDKGLTKKGEPRLRKEGAGRPSFGYQMVRKYVPAELWPAMQDMIDDYKNKRSSDSLNA